MLFINSKGFYTGFPIKTEGENEFLSFLSYTVVAVPSEVEMLFNPGLWNSLVLRSIIC